MHGSANESTSAAAVLRQVPLNLFPRLLVAIIVVANVYCLGLTGCMPVSTAEEAEPPTLVEGATAGDEPEAGDGLEADEGQADADVMNQVIQSNGFDYIAYNDSQRGIAEILRVGRGDDGPVEEVCHVAYPGEGYASLAPLCIKAGRLYYLEYSYLSRYLRESLAYEVDTVQLKSIDLSYSEAQPDVIRLKAVVGVEIANAATATATAVDPLGRTFNLEMLLGLGYLVDGGYAYCISPCGDTLGRIAFIKVDVASGEVECFVAEHAGNPRRFGLIANQEGYLFYFSER